MKPLSKDEPALIQLGKVATQFCIEFFVPGMVGAILCGLVGIAWAGYILPAFWIGLGLYLMVGLPVLFWWHNSKQVNRGKQQVIDATERSH